jgi:hypothetical protein
MRSGQEEDIVSAQFTKVQGCSACLADLIKEMTA